jgi:Spy/CpxP family protein refolding chaperone
MTILSLRALAAGLLVVAAVPAVAQTPPPAGGQMMAGGMRHGGPGGWGNHAAFPSMSEAGRKTMMDAMQQGGDRKAERETVRAARDRMLTILDADRLDSAALKRAMDDERNAANASRERHQAAMLGAFGKLSVTDRKAFVTDSRAMKSRMEQRMQGWRAKRGMGGMDGGDMPPPPPGM